MCLKKQQESTKQRCDRSKQEKNVGREPGGIVTKGSTRSQGGAKKPSVIWNQPNNVGMQKRKVGKTQENTEEVRLMQHTKDGKISEKMLTKLQKKKIRET